YGKVLIITKGTIEECNTKHAQGGIAASIGHGDSPELHIKDTLAAGAGLCDPEAVRILAEEAEDRINDLIKLGVPFDTVDGQVALTKEAAHCTSRILHAGGDATGEKIENTLSRNVRLAGIKVLEQCLATSIRVENGRVKGVTVLDNRSGVAEDLNCHYLILATGGAMRIFPLITYQCGAEITDMEFFQFHPTALRVPGVTPFLISEAVRGEGGILRNVENHRYMPDYCPEAELAPRDVVSRCTVLEMQKTNADRVFLDVTHLQPKLVITRFPTIYQFCLDHGIDITKAPIPVAPAAHYIFACGETACTGVHGANRLASNSMLEVLIFAKRIMQRTRMQNNGVSTSEKKEVYQTIPLNRRVPGTSHLPPVSLSAIQTLMWNNVGIIRSKNKLMEAADILGGWEVCITEAADRPSYELNNLIITGRLMVEAALIREESRGAHFRSDFPEPSPEWLRHIVFKKNI
ncbi:MAG: FAD-binding protein, partial [Chloroflexi bacterium]|nr:FAD-binding protein [Chloroflexota bacterium]